MKITLQLQDGAYYPYDDEAVDFTARKTENNLFVVDVKESRDPTKHRKAFKRLRILYDMIDTKLHFDPWRKMLTVKAGYFQTIGKVDIKGTESVAVIAESLSYENMEEDYFHKCWLAIHQAFCDKYGDLLTMEELELWAAM